MPSHLLVLPAVLLASHGVHLLCCSSTAFSTVTRETGSLKHGGHSLIMKEYSAYSSVLGLLAMSGLRCSQNADKHSLFFAQQQSASIIAAFSLVFTSKGRPVLSGSSQVLSERGRLIDSGWSDAGCPSLLLHCSRTCCNYNIAIHFKPQRTD